MHRVVDNPGIENVFGVVFPQEVAREHAENVLILVLVPQGAQLLNSIDFVVKTVQSLQKFSLLHSQMIQGLLT